MNSRERVLMSLQHRAPDRVPMHMNASKWVVAGLKNHLGLQLDKALLKALHIDVLDTRGIDLHTGIAPRYKGPTHPILSSGNDWGGNVMALWGIEEFEKEGAHGPALEIVPPPLSLNGFPEEWDQYAWPKADFFDFSSIEEELARNSDFSIMASGASVFQHASYLIGLDHQLLDLMMDPERSTYIHDQLLDFYFDYYEQYLKASKGKIDVLALADDFGTQTSLLIGPDLFNQYFKKRIRKLADLAHQYDASLLLHTCGNVEVLIPDFIDAGVDILDPIQPESMDAAHIKNTYGKEICLRGGISCQQVLAHGTKKEVEEEVKTKLDILMPGGGYIFSPGHPVLQSDIPIENIITMYETAFEYGQY